MELSILVLLFRILMGRLLNPEPSTRGEKDDHKNFAKFTGNASKLDRRK